MSMNRRTFLASGAALAGSGMLAGTAFAQSELNIARIMVGFPPGTTPDVLARQVAERLSGDYARNVMVENRTGAGGQLAVTATTSSAPDGATMLLTAMSILGVYPHTYKTLPYDPVADLAPVSIGVTFDFGIGVGPAVPDSVRTVPDLMAWYKANPGQANMASPATGSTLHFVTQMLGRAAGVPITHVGYRGSAPALQDMLGGTLPAICTPLGTLLNQPRLRVLGTSGGKRSRFTPEVPTLAEQGYKDLVYDEWYGFFLPASASPAVVQRLNAALRAALTHPRVLESLATFGMESTPSSPEQHAAALKADLERWGSVVKSVGFTADS